MFDLDRRRRLMVGPALTLLLILLAEVVGHGLGFDQVAVTIFLLALAPIAYAGLRAGFGNALVCTVLLALYSLHYTVPHADVAQLDVDGLITFVILFVLGVGMGWPMDRVRRREESLQAQVQARTRELEARNRELTNANASLEAFGYVVSHDLKEPVRALENYLDAARSEFPGEDSRLYIDEAYAANRRLGRLLQGLLSYSRTSSLPSTVEPVALAEIVRSEGCTAMYATMQAEKGADVEIDPALPSVCGDRVILAQLFGNLILNAIRHHPRSGGRIRVRPVEAAAGRAHVVVQDDGAGFPPDVLARFAQLRTDRPATIKTGFGLAIAQRAAQRLDGRVWLENPPGGGAAAHIELPLAPEPSSDGGTGEIPLDTGEAPRGLGTGDAARAHERVSRKR